MKKHLHYNFTLTKDEVIEVNLSSQANVLLMDDSNYSEYRKKRDFEYIGGFVKATPFRIRPPNNGHWHVVIEGSNQDKKLRAAVRVLFEPLSDQ